jgi:hypothetical protein
MVSTVYELHLVTRAYSIALKNFSWYEDRSSLETLTVTKATFFMCKYLSRIIT